MMQVEFPIPVTAGMILALLRPRDPAAHKGTYGHALLIAGREGMMGAAVLATRAALRSGCGLVSVQVPHTERAILQIAAPEAILQVDSAEVFSEVLSNVSCFQSIGIGPGLGQDLRSSEALAGLFAATGVPLVIDADALNLLAQSQQLLAQLPPDRCILTPHEGEFRRLVGPWQDDAHRTVLQVAFAREHRCFLILKGPATRICTPSGTLYANTTGNAGMAKGGAGDVLTGLLTGLLARGYLPEDAARIGVYSQGRAGDLAAGQLGQEAMNSGDLVEFLPQAMREFE